MYTNHLPTPAPKRSMGDKLKEDAIFMVVGLFIICVFQAVLDFLFNPLSRKDGEAEPDVVDFESARMKRIERQERFALDADDPMVQFQERLVENPEKWKTNDNRKYLKWYKNWKAGKVIDTDLRWAPDCMEPDDTMRANFVQYLKIQYALHKKASWVRRARFLDVIRRYYPELTPTMKGLAEDLANYGTEADERNLTAELSEEIRKIGLPEQIADYLAKKELTAAELQKQAKRLKELLDAGYNSQTCICALENRVTVAERIGMIDYVVTKFRLPAKVGLAYLRNQVTADEVASIARMMVKTMAKADYELCRTREDGTTAYDELVDAALKNARTGKRAELYA